MSEALDTREDDTVHRLHEAADPILLLFAKFRDGFADAMGDGMWTIEDLEQKIASKRAFLFAGANSAVVGEIVPYPGGATVMQMLWATGDVAEIAALAPGVEATARMMGCTMMIVEGQKAWERVLKPQGYGFMSTTLRKVL